MNVFHNLVFIENFYFLNLFLINFIFIIASTTGKDRYGIKTIGLYIWLVWWEQNALQSGVGEGRLKCSAVGLF